MARKECGDPHHLVSKQPVLEIEPLYDEAIILRPEPGDTLLFRFNSQLTNDAIDRLCVAIKEHVKLPEGVNVTVVDDCAAVYLIKAPHVAPEE
jgi:hypothetical protein